MKKEYIAPATLIREMEMEAMIALSGPNVNTSEEPDDVINGGEEWSRGANDNFWGENWKEW